MKTVFIFIPGFGPHGGLRVIVEWANRLAENHVVYLRCLKQEPCKLFRLSPKVRLVYNDANLHSADLAIITSPHSIGYAESPLPRRKVIFLQMMEHLFRPMDSKWMKLCERTYCSPLPLISISGWNMRALRHEFQRNAPTYYVGNGVNLEDFPISHHSKDGKTVLVEGWVPTNPSKDPDRLGPRVAKQLREEGYRILAYSGQPLSMDREYHKVPHEYFCRPDLATLNLLYSRATILIKASRVDARSTAPMEAMTKGTVTVRALDVGDDDLMNGENCLRDRYVAGRLYENAKRLLVDSIDLRERLSFNCLKYVQTFTWEYWFPIIEAILWDKQNAEEPTKSDDRRQ